MIDPQIKSGLYSHPVDLSESQVPAKFFCITCQAAETSKVQNEVGTGVIVSSALLCFVFIPLFWIPCCIGTCKDKVHKCPKCGEVVGTYKFLGD